MKSRLTCAFRMQRILAEAAAVGDATGRGLAFRTRDRDAYYYPNSAWHTAFIGGDYEFAPGRVLNLDGRTLFFYLTWGVSPAMAMKMVGMGSQYAMAVHDATGAYLDGGSPTACTCRRTSRRRASGQ